MGREHPRALGDEDERLHLLGRVLLSGNSQTSVFVSYPRLKLILRGWSKRRPITHKTDLRDYGSNVEYGCTDDGFVRGVDKQVWCASPLLLSLHHRKHIEKTWSNEMQSMLLTHLLLEELP